MRKTAQLFRNGVNFNDSLPGLNRHSIETLLKANFPGKDHFILLYSKKNGGYFDGGAYLYRDDFQQLDRTDRNLFEIEAFNFLPTTGNQESWRLLSTAYVSKCREVHYGLSTAFLSRHIPFASDAGDNDFWLETETGIICYTETEELGSEPNALLVAPDFRTFCNAIRGSLKPFTNQ